MNKRQKIIVSITGIFLVLLILIGITYAYFITRIQGNEETKSISVTTANLSLVYGNDDGSIIGEGEKIVPNTTFEEKTFTVTNNGNAPIESYAVILEDVKTFYTEEFKDENAQTVEAGTQTEFVSPEDFNLAITCTKYNKADYEAWVNSEEENKSIEDLTSIGTCNGMNGTLPLMESTIDSNIKYITNGVLLTNPIGIDEVHRYSVILKYNETGNDQSADMNKTLEGKFNIIDAHNTVDITGKVDEYTKGDIIETNSVKRTSQINSDGTYKIVGLEQGVHSVKLVSKTQTTEISKLSILKGETEGFGETTIDEVTMPQITITEETRDVKVNITEGKLEYVEEKMITFTIGSNAYTIPEGTTWAEFVASDISGNFKIEDGVVRFFESNEIVGEIWWYLARIEGSDPIYVDNANEAIVPSLYLTMSQLNA